MAPPPPTFPELFPKLIAPQGPSGETVRAALGAILAGAWAPVQVAGFAVALRAHPETPEMISAAAQAMRAAMIPVEHDLDCVVDTCGTGGDGQHSLNLSTAAALVVAAAGFHVAKHGNRAVSSRAGSADVLQALGIPLDTPSSDAATILREAHIAFLLAPTHHPAMRHAAAARKELQIRTIFNCLGPLSNPARATHQLLGSFDDALRPVFAETLAALGTQRAWVVRGHDGLDEISPFGPTSVTELSHGRLRELEVKPQDFGLALSPPGAIAGGDAAENAEAIAGILRGEQHPARDAVILNAAAALVVAGSLSLRDAADRARSLLDRGEPWKKLQAWREIAGRFVPSKAI